MTENRDKQKSLNFLELLQSTLWAALGVQREDNYKRDFTRGHWVHFVLAGLAFSGFFVGALIGIVYIVMANL